MNERYNTLKINPPEGISFSLYPAGPVPRFLAWIIDLACISALAGVLNSFFASFAPAGRDTATALSILGYFVVATGYGILIEWYWHGQSAGKKLFRLRVIDASGMNLSFSQVAVRNLLRPVDSLPLFYLTGGLSTLVTKNSQRLGDLAANTIVIRTPQITEPDLTEIFQDKYNSFRDHPHLIARLRQQISPGEAETALRALIRRNELAPDARVSLFQTTSEHFKQKVAFPAKTTDGLSDEQYTRNVVDVLFRS